MKKTIATLVAVVVIAAVIDVAVAAATSPPHVKGQQQTSITMTDYPKQPVTVGQDYNVAGHLTSSETGLANKVVFEEWQLNGTWVPNGGNVTTNAVGFFTSSWYAGNAGTWSFRYKFLGDAQYAPCVSEAYVITAS
jgi:hypothetical protein